MKKLVIFGVLLLFLATVAAAEAAMVWTDKDDYNPLETVYVSGLHYLPNQNIDLRIQRPDGVLELFQIPSDGAGTFSNFEYYLNEERALPGNYFACALDGLNWACTTFTDNNDCNPNIQSECTEEGTVKLVGTIECEGEVDLFIEDGGGNELENCTQTDNTIECDTGETSVSGNFWLGLHPCACEECLAYFTQEPFSLTENCPAEVPEFSGATAIAVVALLLAGYGVYRVERKK